MALPDFESAIHTKISNIAAVTAIVGTKIDSFYAIAGTARPYVTFIEASHVNPQLATDTTLTNAVWRISAWADTPAAAQALEDALYDGLHDSALTLSGYTNYWIRHEGRQHIPVNDDGTEYWHYVGDYRIKADSD